MTASDGNRSEVWRTCREVQADLPPSPPGRCLRQCRPRCPARCCTVLPGHTNVCTHTKTHTWCKMGEQIQMDEFSFQKCFSITITRCYAAILRPSCPGETNSCLAQQTHFVLLKFTKLPLDVTKGALTGLLAARVAIIPD